jgi:hypothetical protein
MDCVRGERLFRAFLVVNMVSLIMHVVNIQNLMNKDSSGNCPIRSFCNSSGFMGA